MFRRVLALVPLFLLAAAPAVALRGPRLEVRVQSLPGTLRAGETVVISWDELPGDVAEMELLLSLDDGRRFTMRISPELDGRTRSYHWRVPDLAADRARLQIRAGGARGEREGVPSAAFRIEPAAPGASDAIREDVLWMTFEPGEAAEAIDLASSETRLFAANGEAAISGAPDAPAFQRARASRRTEDSPATFATSLPPRAAKAAPSRRTPLRN